MIQSRNKRKSVLGGRKGRRHSHSLTGHGLVGQWKT